MCRILITFVILHNTIVINKFMTITYVKTLKERLIYARELRGLTQGELAVKCKCAQSTIGNIESGTRQTLKNLVIVARVLKISADWLYDGKGPKPEKSDAVVNLANEKFQHASQTIAAFSGAIAADVGASTNIRQKQDPWITDVVNIMSKLDENQKLAALARLREFVSFLDPPRDGQALSVAV